METSHDINKKALIHLANQKWMSAQKMLFYNAHKNPSHETYNNLGFYLITEGLECKNGRVKSAKRLGLKYLVKARNIKRSSINSFAIALAYDYQIRNANDIEKEDLCNKVRFFFEEAFEYEKSNELHYNVLRMKYLTGVFDESILSESYSMLCENPSLENVILVLNLADANRERKLGEKILSKYGAMLDSDDKLLFCTKFEMYEEGYRFCLEVLDQFQVDEILLACILLCCTNTGKLQEAQYYLDSNIKHIKTKEKLYFQNALKHRGLMDKIKESVANYQRIPPIISKCCFFDCPIHSNKIQK